MTGHAVAGRDLAQQRLPRGADTRGVAAAWSEAAAARRIDQDRDRAADRLQPYLVLAGEIDARDRADQSLGIGMAGIAEELVDRRLLHHLAGIHHDDALRGLGDDAHGM